MDPPQFIFEEQSNQQYPNLIIPHEMELFRQSSQSSQSSQPHHLQYETPSIHQPNKAKTRRNSFITNEGDFNSLQANQQERRSELQIHIQPRQRKHSSTYEEKVDLFHLQKASQIKKSIFANQEVSSPTINKDAQYFLKPHQNEEIHETHNQQDRRKQLKLQGSKLKLVPIEMNSSFNNLVVQETFQQIKAPSQMKDILIPLVQKSEFEFVRNKNCGSYYHPIYTIKIKDGNQVLSARKKCFSFNSCYSIICGEEQVGRLVGNFGGTQFNLYQLDEKLINLKQMRVATIFYQAACSCSTSPRQIQIYFTPIKTQNLMFENERVRRNLKCLFQDGYSQVERLVTKQPKWNEKGQFYSLPFEGKAKYPSIKNTILVDEKNPHKNALLFCKTDLNTFHLEVQSNVNLLIAIGIIVSSFDFKLFCQ